MSGDVDAESNDFDAALFDELRTALNEADPVPDLVLETARAAFAMRRVEAELAELVRDSSDDRGSMLAVRGEGDVRLISFETNEVSVELQVTDRGSTRDLVAQVSGAAVATAEIETPLRKLRTVLEDTMVLAEGVPAGLLRLRLLTTAGRDLITSWVRV